jgi:2'-5' RNA ligase
VRLFVAVWPPPDVVAVLRALPREESEHVRWTREPQWHVTLRFLGSVAQDQVPAIGGALDSVPAAPVAVRMGPATACFGRGILHVAVAGLEELAAAVVGATVDFGDPPEPRPFRGHLTLARARSRRGDLRRFRGMACAGAWTVGEVTLVCSRPDREGVRYEVLHRSNLRQ